MPTKTTRAPDQAPTSATRKRAPRRSAAATLDTTADGENAAASAPAPAPPRAASPAKRAVRSAKTGVTTRTARKASTAKSAPAARAQTAPAIEPLIEAPTDGALFGDYAVRIPDEEPATLTLRAAHSGSALCTCLDFQLSEHGECPHLQAVLAALQADAARAAALARGPQQPGSRLALRQGARRQALWLPGLDCPAALDESVRKTLAASPLDAQGLARLLRAAREAGHEIEVDEALWTQLAVARDVQARVQRLETLFPQGPSSVELQTLVLDHGRPLLPLQVEGALFAVCAGRAILADAPALQPARQALAAALLWQRHFDVERVLVLAPSARLPRWQQALPADATGFTLAALEGVAQDADALQAVQAAQAELVIVDEDDSGLWIDAERAAALLRLAAPLAIVLPAADWLQRPAELPLRVAFVDAHRLGAYEALLQTHGLRDEEGGLCGLHELAALPRTLGAVLLARTLDEVREQLPERVESLRRVPMPAAVQAEHAALATALAAAVARAQRSGWLADAQQRQLLAQVQALRRLCAGVEAPAVVAAKAQALQALLDDAEAPVAKAVVCAQWPQALSALQTALAQAGIEAALCSGAESAAARDAARTRFQDDPACRVLLVADAGGSALELRVPQAQLVHLDRPWNARVLARRFGRVHRRGQARLVPVTHLLLQDSFEDACAQVLGARAAPAPVDVLDAGAEHGFVPAAAVPDWLSELAEVLRAAGQSTT